MIKFLQLHKLVCWSNESVEEWMGRLRTAAVQCKYKELDRQLKEQFIHCLNDDEMLVEVIRELTKCGGDVTIPSEIVLAWTKRVEAQRVQTVVISNFHTSRNFAITYKENRLGSKGNASNRVITKRDAGTVDKSINQDDAQHMAKGAISTTMK